MGGRLAYTHSDVSNKESLGEYPFNVANTTVHLYNYGAGSVAATNVSVYGMSCGWRADLPPPKMSVVAPR
jgi:hypothetical protein